MGHTHPSAALVMAAAPQMSWVPVVTSGARLRPSLLTATARATRRGNTASAFDIPQQNVTRKRYLSDPQALSLLDLGSEKRQICWGVIKFQVRHSAVGERLPCWPRDGRQPAKTAPTLPPFITPPHAGLGTTWAASAHGEVRRSQEK